MCFPEQDYGIFKLASHLQRPILHAFTLGWTGKNRFDLTTSLWAPSTGKSQAHFKLYLPALYTARTESVEFSQMT
jgi:hypothetical protein